MLGYAMNRRCNLPSILIGPIILQIKIADINNKGAQNFFKICPVLLSVRLKKLISSKIITKGNVTIVPLVKKPIKNKKAAMA